MHFRAAIPLLLLATAVVAKAKTSPAATAKSCKNGQSLCDGICQEFSNNPDNCGRCGNACNSRGGQICSGGTCTCSTKGDIYCGRSCTNPNTDSANCGKCNNVCNAQEGLACSGGSCVCAVNGDTFCGSSCTNTNTDSSNCGKCGNSCSNTETCLNGSCVSAQCPNGATGCVAGQKVVIRCSISTGCFCEQTISNGVQCLARGTCTTCSSDSACPGGYCIVAYSACDSACPSSCHYPCSS